MRLGTTMKKLFIFISLIAIAAACSKKPASSVMENKKKDAIVVITTDLGKIHLVLFDEAPQHKANFLKLAESGFYDSTAFHRVLKDFMIQGGDPNSKPGGPEAEIGMGGPGYTVPAEFVDDFKHDKGMLAAARQGDQINPEKRSSGSQFYIVQNEDGAHHLDGAYTIFGKVVKGLETVDEIAAVEVGRGGRPVEPVHMNMEVRVMKKKDITEMYGFEYPDKE